MTHSPALPIAESDVDADTAVDSSREAILAARLDARLFMRGLHAPGGAYHPLCYWPLRTMAKLSRL